MGLGQGMGIADCSDGEGCWYESLLEGIFPAGLQLGQQWGEAEGLCPGVLGLRDRTLWLCQESLT